MGKGSLEEEKPQSYVEREFGVQKHAMHMTEEHINVEIGPRP